MPDVIDIPSDWEEMFTDGSFRYLDDTQPGQVFAATTRGMKACPIAFKSMDTDDPRTSREAIAFCLSARRERPRLDGPTIDGPCDDTSMSPKEILIGTKATGTSIFGLSTHTHTAIWAKCRPSKELDLLYGRQFRSLVVFGRSSASIAAWDVVSPELAVPVARSGPPRDLVTHRFCCGDRMVSSNGPSTVGSLRRRRFPRALLTNPALRAIRRHFRPSHQSSAPGTHIV